jgi:protein-S-isoprenylcysteine O-methyltransferase Ste14
MKLGRAGEARGASAERGVMSITPAFLIGVWNAWIFVLYALVLILLIPIINKSASKTGGHGSVLSKIENVILYSYHIIFFLQCIYSIFLPLKLGTLWFYTGLPITLFGLAIYTTVIASFIITPLDREIMTKGPFRYSRHPMYLSSSLALIGIGIACASWLFLLLSVAYMVLSMVSAASEERFLLAKYGDSYSEYMNRTPRWIGVPKSSRYSNHN